ncbi:hypothetical protein [Corynebacterium mayonis]|uniref:hypothetical protein n=1 Tax=Corynebacterium mayonis TaxID=3062461 RepID=UPI00313FE2BC
MSGTQRPRKDNVIYANFGARRREAPPKEQTGSPVARFPTARARVETPTSQGPAARRLLAAALNNADEGRIARGKKYAEQGHVIELLARQAGFDALVAGSQNDPFTVVVQLPRRSAGDIQEMLTFLASQAGAVDKARRGELSPRVLSALLAPDSDSIRFFCDCPDDARVCKHAVAVAVKAAELVDAHPATVFSLRSLTLDMVEKGVQRQASEVAKENAKEGSDFFWAGRELPKLPKPKVAPMIDDSDLELLHRAVASVSFTNIDQMRAVADVEDLYDELIRED